MNPFRPPNVNRYADTPVKLRDNYPGWLAISMKDVPESEILMIKRGNDTPVYLRDVEPAIVDLPALFLPTTTVVFLKGIVCRLAEDITGRRPTQMMGADVSICGFILAGGASARIDDQSGIFGSAPPASLFLTRSARKSANGEMSSPTLAFSSAPT